MRCAVHRSLKSEAAVARLMPRGLESYELQFGDRPPGPEQTVESGNIDLVAGWQATFSHRGGLEATYWSARITWIRAARWSRIDLPAAPRRSDQRGC